MDVPLDWSYEKDYLVWNLPNKSKLHIVQLHFVQKYMDVAILLFLLIAPLER